MNGLASYFGDDSIIDLLCSYRLKAAQRIAEASFVGTPEMIMPNPLPRLPNIFPPRRHWKRFRPHFGLNGADSAHRSLFLAIKRLRVEEPGAPWAKNLAVLIEKVRRRALYEPKFAFAAPRIVAEEKDRVKGEYRPIALFLPEDNLICSLVARYWRDFLGPLISPTCLSFNSPRCDKTGCYAPNGPERILAFRGRHVGMAIWVADADIVAFYDSVAHDVAWACLQRLEEQAARFHRRKADVRALELIQAYLGAYCFADALREETGLRKALHNRRAHFMRPCVAPGLRTGLPQGGAISNTIVHAVLHEADLAVASDPRTGNTDVLYLRFVDDMVLMSTSRDACQRGYGRYLDALTGLGLRYHPPAVLRRYGPDFWDHKSKAPYRWDESRQPGTAPWIRFLGHDINASGALRVSTRSVKKHLRKINQFVGHTWKRLSAASSLQISREKIQQKVEGKVTAMAVGRRPGQATQKVRCWARAFQVLSGHGHQLTQLRELDRQRGRILIRFRAKVRDFFELSGEMFRRNKARSGYEKSYVAAFERRKGRPTNIYQ